jgi:hypothetical protein
LGGIVNRRLLGCFTPSGLLASLFTLAIVAAVWFLRGGALFSPGALNAAAGAELGGVVSHAALEGNCSACHAPFWVGERMADRCLACHESVAAELQDPQSLHGGLESLGSEMQCRDCHTEHNGPEAPLTAVDMLDFPHEVTGFLLASHREMADGSEFACQHCHTVNLSEFEPAACDECHAELDRAYMDQHVAAFGGGCLACHDGLETYGADFDHNRIDFQLTGQHADLGCAECHQGATTLAALQSAPQDCFDCHQQDDVHTGQFGEDCAACHTPESWEGAEFDHSQTAYPLVGKHTLVECGACHVDRQYAGTSKTCFACHQQDDPHEGQFGQECAACHTPEGWEIILFDHAASAFPLTGAHTALDCQQCHIDGRFSGLSTACAACHADPAYHAGLFTETCDTCHSTNAWRPATFNRSHDIFPMGHEGANTCQDCHVNSLSTYTCYTCHDQAETDEEHRDEGISDFADCMRCHAGGASGEDEGRRDRGGGDDD